MVAPVIATRDDVLAQVRECWPDGPADEIADLLIVVMEDVARHAYNRAVKAIAEAIRYMDADAVLDLDAFYIEDPL
jgi:hypothetical protein